MADLQAQRGQAVHRDSLNLPALAICIAFPWLWPIAGGPTATVLPWLVSATCATVMVVLATLMRSNLPGAAAWGWLLAALLSSASALVQYVGFSAARQPWVNVAPLGEAFGKLRKRNQVATLTNLGLAVAMFGLARRKPTGLAAADAQQSRQRGESVALSAMTLLAAIVLAAANAATLSRTGLLQLLTLAMLLLLWRANLPRTSRWVLMAAVLTYAIASIALPMLIGRDPFSDGIGGRFRNPELACSARVLLWRNVLHLIALKPWWGWGWGELSYAHFVTLYPQGRFCEILDNAHNLPLHLAVVWGIPAALAICGAVVVAVLRASPWRETMPARQMAWAVLAMIGLHSMLEYPLWYGPFQIATALAIWMLWHTRSQPALTDGDRACDSGGDVLQVGSTTRERRIPMAAVLVGAVVSLAALAYAAWDYHRVSQVYLAPYLRAVAYRDDTLRKVQDSWLFRQQVRFAALTLSTVTPENAQGLNTMARDLLHFSPESRVVEKLIDSDLALGRRDDAAYFMQRYRTAFPAEYDRWQARSHDLPLPELPPPGP